MTTHKFHDYKVLPFDTAQGRVPGHELRVHHYDWLESPIKSIVFSIYDDVAGMAVEVLVPYQCYTEWTKKRWPAGGRVAAVLTENGRRVYATERFCGHSDAGYDRAPLICRDSFSIETLGSGHTLVEIVGVRAWLYSKRDDAATAEHLVDPWARDNAALEARMAAAKA